MVHGPFGAGKIELERLPIAIEVLLQC